MMQTFVGTSGYSYPAWKGSFYPKDMKSDGMLSYYAERFSAVEINNTFYRMPKKDMLEKWPAQVSPGFSFILKASQVITHMRRLKDVSSQVTYFLDTAAVLGPQLGPVLFQLHPTMKKDVARLTDFLAVVPEHTCAVLEFRHQSWFDDEVYDALRAHNAALCVSEMDEEATPLVRTADWGYLRLRRGDYEDARLATWLDRIRSQGWDRAYVFFKHEDEARGPAFATRFIDLLNS
jgi:uncharacterized protein YecE (DUF72 family)